MKITLSESEAIELTSRFKAGYREGNLLGVIMPNGKRFGECTGEYVGQIAQAMQELGSGLDRARAALK
jgi:hypothetical protein